MQDICTTQHAPVTPLIKQIKMHSHSETQSENGVLKYNILSRFRIPGLICGPVKDGSGVVWGVLTVADPVGADAFDGGHLETFK